MIMFSSNKMDWVMFKESFDWKKIRQKWLIKSVIVNATEGNKFDESVLFSSLPNWVQILSLHEISSERSIKILGEYKKLDLQ